MDTYTQAVPPRRRYLALEQKRLIVEETFAEGASVAQIARAHESRPIWYSTGADCIVRGNCVAVVRTNCCLYAWPRRIHDPLRLAIAARCPTLRARFTVIYIQLGLGLDHSNSSLPRLRGRKTRP